MYQKDTKFHGIFYQRDGVTNELQIFVDASWANFIQTTRSSTRILEYLGNHLVYWTSKLKYIILDRIVEE